MKTIFPCVLGLALVAAWAPSDARLQRAAHSVRQEPRHVAATIDGRDSPPEATLCRSDDTTRHPLVKQQGAAYAVRQEHRHATDRIDDQDSQVEATLNRPDDTSLHPVVEQHGEASTLRQEHLYVPARIAGGNDQLESMLYRSDGTTADLLAQPQAVSYTVRQEYLFFPARIDGRDYQLEAMLYRPDDANRHSLVVFSHGRNGMYPSRDPNMVSGYSALGNALAAEGHVVAYIVRRGYGNSDGPDSELQDTAVLSGLEAAKDYAAAVAYWRTKDFVLPDRVVLMGQSQGGWAVLACTNVAMEGVVGVVNISGGTNYRLMGTGAVTSAVQDHWVAGCTELGAHAVVPSFWIYSENDQSIPGPTSRRMFDAFTAAGGEATLLMLPPWGSNGHGIVGQPDLFMSQVDDYFAAIGFNDEPDSPPAIGPVSGADTVSLDGTAVFTASVTGNPRPALQWRKDGLNLRNGGDISGVTTATLRIAHLQPADAGSYTLVATNALGTAVSSSVVVEFPITAPSLLTQPQNQTVTSGASATFTVGVVGNPAPTYQWQWIPAGTNIWTNLTEGSGYAGVTSPTLTVNATTTRMSGDQFRCVSASSAGSVTSKPGMLAVNTAAVVPPAPSSGGGGGAISLWFVAALALLAGARWVTQKHRGNIAPAGQKTPGRNT